MKKNQTLSWLSNRSCIMDTVFYYKEFIEPTVTYKFALQINIGKPVTIPTLCHMFILVCEEFSAVSTNFIFESKTLITSLLQLSHCWDIKSSLKDSFNFIFIHIIRKGSEKFLIFQDIFWKSVLHPVINI